MIGAPCYDPASPIAIRDGTFTRLQAISALKNVYRYRTMPTKDAATPFVSVFHAGERTRPMGDANVGAPSFDHTLTLAIDVVTTADSEDDLDQSIVGLVETIKATLLTDGTWVELFEGIERCDTRYSYPKETTDYFVEATLEFEVTFRSIWEPYLPNELLQVVTTYPPATLGPIQSITFETPS